MRLARIAATIGFSLTLGAAQMGGCGGGGSDGPRTIHADALYQEIQAALTSGGTGAAADYVRQNVAAGDVLIESDGTQKTIADVDVVDGYTWEPLVGDGYSETGSYHSMLFYDSFGSIRLFVAISY